MASRRRVLRALALAVPSALLEFASRRARATAPPSSAILITSNLPCSLRIDGEDVGAIAERCGAAPFPVVLGEHIVEGIADRQTVRKSVDVTEPTQKIVRLHFAQECPECEGRGENPASCTRCGGDGTIVIVEECSECGGDGREHYYVTCPNCRGSGTVHNGLLCGQCFGRKRLYEELECKRCRGSRTQQKEKSCVRCHGTGTMRLRCERCGGDGDLAEPC